MGPNRRIHDNATVVQDFPLPGSATAFAGFRMDLKTDSLGASMTVWRSRALPGGFCPLLWSRVCIARAVHTTGHLLETNEDDLMPATLGFPANSLLTTPP